jgi:hypothetical protein
MAALSPNPLIRHLPVGAAVAVAVIAAGVFALMPADALEQTVWRSGIAALIPAAQPPLGSTARAVLALAFAAIGAAVTWSALFLLVGPGGLLAPRRHRATDIPSEPPSVRRADAHPDAPPRRPMTAADLGTPMMDVHAAKTDEPERPIPTDLDQPLAAFDPLAILPVPMEPVRPVAPLLTIADPRPAVVASGAIVEDPAVDVTIDQVGESETVAVAPEPVAASHVATSNAAPTLYWPAERGVTAIGSGPTLVVDTPAPVRADPPVSARGDAEPSIESLLRRLEQGSMRRQRRSAG